MLNLNTNLLHTVGLKVILTLINAVSTLINPHSNAD